MYLLLTKPPKYPRAANRMLCNHFHRKHCRIGYCQSLSAKTPPPLFFCELWMHPLWQMRVPPSKHLTYEGPSDRHQSLLWAEIYGFKISRLSTFIASAFGFILFVPTWWSISFKKRLWIIPISVTLQLNVIQRGSIGCCNLDAHKKNCIYLFIYFLLITDTFSQHFALINY